MKVMRVLCERGRQRALTRWDVRGKFGCSPSIGGFILPLPVRLEREDAIRSKHGRVFGFSRREMGRSLRGCSLTRPLPKAISPVARAVSDVWDCFSVG